jgi:hypothetical protein
MRTIISARQSQPLMLCIFSCSEMMFVDTSSAVVHRENEKKKMFCGLARQRKRKQHIGGKCANLQSPCRISVCPASKGGKAHSKFLVKAAQSVPT